MPHKITLYGKQTVDYLMVTNKIPPTTQIQELRKPRIIPDWKTLDDLIINCNFTSDLNSSYITGMTSPFVGFEVYKIEKDSTSLEKIATVDKNVSSIIDYFVKNNTEYSWYVFPITQNEVGVSMQSAFQKVCWWDWTIIGLDEIEPNSNSFLANEIFKFTLNVQSEAETQTRDITIMNGLSQYPKTSVGMQNYLTSGISAMLGHVKTNENGKEYVEPALMKQKWYDFIAKGKPCLLKDRAGNVRKVSIEADSTAKVMDELKQQPNLISFKWRERGDTNKMAVYEIPPQND